jgi:ferredoxin-like protein FixX
MPDTADNIKPCPLCNGIMCWHGRTIIEVAHWNCVECGRVKIVKEDE